MNRSWMAGAKALAATTALVCVAMVATTATKADTYSYSYLKNDNGYAQFTGTFEATITGFGSNISSYSPIIISNANGTFGGQAFNGTVFSTGGPIGSIDGTLSIVNGSGSFNALLVGQYGGVGVQSASGSISGDSNSFSFGTASLGLFSAMDTTPSSGGGGGSGGAPTPEVNAGLGILIAGASFAFLRRKRGTRHEAAAA